MSYACLDSFGKLGVHLRVFYKYLQFTAIWARWGRKLCCSLFCFGQEPYWIVLHDRIVSVINSPSLTSETEWVGYPFQLFDFTACHQSYSEMNCSYTLALAHAVWHHSSIGQLSLIPKYVEWVLCHLNYIFKFCAYCVQKNGISSLNTNKCVYFSL